MGRTLNQIVRVVLEHFGVMDSELEKVIEATAWVMVSAGLSEEEAKAVLMRTIDEVRKDYPKGLV